MNAVVVSMLLLVVACGDVVGSVTVTVNRTGAGKIESSGGTLQCNGTTCTMTVVEGTMVTLTPTAARGTRFEGWSGGACSGTAPCTFNADADVTIAAGFGVARITLTVAKMGNAGAITSVPAGIDCGTDCTAELDFGTTITLATPAVSGGTIFMGWSGAGCWGTDNCVTTMTDDATITATFICIAGTRTFNYTGGAQNVTVPPCASQVVIEASGAQGGGPGVGQFGGMGATIKGTFVTPVTVPTGLLQVMVGGQGAGSASGNGGGGGGTFVYLAATDALPLVVAGGGGGRSTNSQCTPAGGSDTEAGVNPVMGSGTGAHGTGGNGGAGGVNVGAPTDTSGGGAGWLTNGAPGSTAPTGGGGIAPRNGGAGGTAGVGGAVGGYGGGGGSVGSSGSSGGGGGYNGGGGGNSWNGQWGCGGGGGSYNSATDVLNTANARAGNGQAIITWQ